MRTLCVIYALLFGLMLATHEPPTVASAMPTGDVGAPTPDYPWGDAAL